MRGSFRATGRLASLLLVTCVLSSAARAQTTALAVDSTLAAMAAAPLWPTFEPMRVPVAIFDGSRTWLFRHPHPPAEYHAFAADSHAAVRDGRDPAVTANTSARLGGVTTATVMLDPRSSASDVAALTVHELFHVFQRTHHAKWQANEADLFTYPFELADALALRLEETDALRRALRASSADSAECWGRRFLATRRARARLIGAAAIGYERGTELNEGLARYVELRARHRLVALPAEEYAADQPRQRAYEVGAGVGQLLDKLSPAWREMLETVPPDSVRPLEAELSPQVSNRGAAVCGDGDSLAYVATARERVRALDARRASARAGFLGGRGATLIVEAGAAPVFPQGFDPLNVTRVSATEVLHGRYLSLGYSTPTAGAGSIEVLSRPALTTGRPRQHPLFGGVARLTLAGFARRPEVRDSAGTLFVVADGVKARLPGARADTTGRTVRIRLP